MAGFRPQEPGCQQRLGIGDTVMQGERAAMAQQHDDRLAGGGDRIGQRLLRGGQLDHRARLRLARHRLGFADRQDHHVRRLRRRDGAGDPVLDRAVDRAAQFDRQLRGIGHRRAQAGGDVDTLVGIAVKGPGAVEIGLVLAERADQRDPLPGSGIKRQHPLILEQHDRSRRRLTRQRMMGGRADARLFNLFVERAPGIVEQPHRGLHIKDAAHGNVDRRHRHRAALHQIGDMADIEAALHRHIDPGQHREAGGVALILGKAMGDQFLVGGVIGEDEAAKLHLAAQYVGQQFAVGGGGHAVNLVEGGHGGERAGGKGLAEGRQMGFAQRLVTDVDAAIFEARRDRAIGGEMLGTGEQRIVAAQVAPLEAANPRRRQQAGQIDILARALDHPAPALVARDIDHRREGEVQAGCRRLHRHDPRGLFHQQGIEAGSLPQRHGKDGLEPVNHVARQQQRDAQAAVLDRHFLRAAPAGNANAVEQAADPALANLVRQALLVLDAGRRIGRVEGTEAVGEAGHLPGLLLQRHLRDQRIDAGNVGLRQCAAGDAKGEDTAQGADQEVAAIKSHAGESVTGEE